MKNRGQRRRTSFAFNVIYMIMSVVNIKCLDKLQGIFMIVEDKRVGLVDNSS